jgi:hypothetical protein
MIDLCLPKEMEVKRLARRGGLWGVVMDAQLFGLASCQMTHVKVTAKIAALLVRYTKYAEEESSESLRFRGSKYLCLGLAFLAYSHTRCDWMNHKYPNPNLSGLSHSRIWKYYKYGFYVSSVLYRIFV